MTGKKPKFTGTPPFCARCGDNQRPMKFIGMESRGYVFECVKPVRFRGKIRRYEGCGHRTTVEKSREIEPPQRLPKPHVDDTLPHGVVPTLDEAGKPLGYVSGYHVGPGPHFPWHDTRRIYQQGV